MSNEAEEIRKQMRQFQNAAEHFLGPVADFTTKSLNDGGAPVYTHDFTRTVFVGWMMRDQVVEMEKVTPRGLIAYEVELLLMGDPCENSQIIVAAKPDLTPAQWAALGAKLSAVDAHNLVNVDELAGE